MSTTEPIHAESPLQRLIGEHAVAMAKEMESAANEAADGTVLETCEKLVLDRGRELLCIALEATLQSQAEQVEKKGPPAGPARAAHHCTPRGNTRAAS